MCIMIDTTYPLVKLEVCFHIVDAVVKSCLNVGDARMHNMVHDKGAQQKQAEIYGDRVQTSVRKLWAHVYGTASRYTVQTSQCEHVKAGP